MVFPEGCLGGLSGEELVPVVSSHQNVTGRGLEREKENTHLAA